MYFYGLDAEVDYSEAIRWYSNAASMGHTEAQLKLGDCYKDGTGVEPDPKMASMWYGKAIKSYKKNGCWWELGCCYELGRGVEQDYPKAVELYEKASNQGDADAQNSLGDCYYYGKGVEKDYSKAVEYFRRAVNQDQTESQYSLGHCYYYGQGVDVDKEKAILLFEKSAQQGYQPAKDMLEKIQSVTK